MRELFAAVERVDVDAVRRLLVAGADVHAVDPYGFTPLERAAMSSARAENRDVLEVLRLLLHAKSPLEHSGGGGRTALYLAAEFSWTVEPVQLLLDAGANPDVRCEKGRHVVLNAQQRAVKALLAQVTGRPMPPERPAPPKPRKLSAAEWRAAEERVHVVFEQLTRDGFVTLGRAGTTQEDGLDDCSELWRERGGAEAGLIGFCFYMTQDVARAKRTGALFLAFWAAPEGAPAAMERAGARIVEAFVRAGFVVDWSGAATERPTLYLAPAAT